MGFTFSAKDKSTEKAVRRIARERLDASQALLADPKLPRDALVHELRKNIKKTRALLRLVRPHFKGYERENAALRDAARLISDLRDADVLATTFDDVASRIYMPPDALAALRDRIVRPRAGGTDADKELAGHAESIAAIARRAKDWKISGAGFDALEDGLERSWTAARKAMNAAENDPTGEALHLWRKRVKDHWYHARLLTRIWPEMMSHHIAAADILGETLGDARDLAYLIEALKDEADAADLRARAAEEEARLLADARTLGELFFSERASGLSRRWRGWWDIWRAS
ncbi:CHAD domain-containing protein [Defluviimonas sp. SAOS-178_SWC]|uniref:CHAD domain-containing protein n=1 Tax=Defluviimonas sp. SAOS-178_SWC TaxID=3121287 RepID=UPI003221717F